MNQSELLAISCNLLKAREKSPVQRPLVLVLLLTGRKTGATLLSQSRHYSRQSFENCPIIKMNLPTQFPYLSTPILQMHHKSPFKRSLRQLFKPHGSLG